MKASRLSRATLLASFSCMALASCAPINGALGRDRASKRDECVVVAPRGMRAADLARSVEVVTGDVAREHGHLRVLVATGPSAAAFPWIDFGSDAHGGDFASDAANAGARTHDAQRWQAAALAAIDQQLAAVELGAGLDLVGGIRQCVESLDGSHRSRVVAVISTGLHQTVDLDIVDQADAMNRLAEQIAQAVLPPVALELHEIGRVDPEPFHGPPSRVVMERVTGAWTAACRDLHDRCLLADQ